MRNKKTFLLALIVLTLTSAVNADLVLTLNGLDTAKEFAEIKGKNNLVIAVAGDTEVDPNSYHIEAVGGVLQANPNTVSPENYSFAFEDESMIGIVRLIVNNDMVIDGTSVKEGDMIYNLFLVYISETDTVISCGLNLESLSPLSPELEPEPEPELQPEPEPELQPETQSQPEPAPEPQPVPELNPEPEAAEVTAEPRSVPALKAPPYFGAESERGTRSRKFRTLTKQVTEKMSKLEYFPEESSPASPYTTGLRGAGEASGEGGGEGRLGMLMMGEGGGDYTEIPAGPLTENTIWDSNVRLLGCVEVNNVMLVIKPGVEVRITNGEEGIIVRNNGCLIANGTPDEMIYFFPTTAFPYVAYGSAIKLEETASSLCEISYCQMYCAFDGIFISNKRLESPIHDNSFWDCGYGVWQFGQMLTDVVNNEVYNPADPELFGLYGLLTAGIVTYLPDACGVASSATEIYIGNNTIAGNQTWGIYVSGVEDPNEAGTVIIANNLIAGSRHTGIYLVNGWMRSLTICNGFYLNNNNMNVSGGGSLGEYVRDPNSVIVEDFNSYALNSNLWAVWKDGGSNGTRAEVSVLRGVDWPDLVLDGNSIEYWYNRNDLEPYYSEVEANAAELPSGVGTDWTSYDANTLTLYFYGQFDNDFNEQMYVKLTDGDQEDFYVLENFNSYTHTSNPPYPLRGVWKDYGYNGTCAEVFLITGLYWPNLVRDGNSMQYCYENHTYPPYYSEAEADVCDLPGGIGSDWLGLGAQTLSLWFYGQTGNDASQQMYVILADSNDNNSWPVYYCDYGDMNDICEETWHQWNIRLEDFYEANLADVNKIIIGFWDWDEDPAASDGIVYIDDIRLYAEYPPRPHTVKIAYHGSPYSLIEDWWHVWNIPFTELNDINLANVKTISIGFGDGNAPYSYTGEGTIYFDEIILRSGPAEEPFDDGSVELDEDPFVNGFDFDSDPLYIKPDCPLIGAGAGYIDEYPYLLGKTTYYYPDTNMVNIGFHYFNWNYSNAGDGDVVMADLNQDRIVNFNDFAILAAGWLTTYDYNDLYTMANEWLQMEPLFANIVPSFDKDPNNLSRYVQTDINVSDSNIYRIFAMIDGQSLGEFFIEMEEESPYVGIQTERFTNGPHTIKIVSVDIYGNVICSQVNEVIFNNDLNSVTMSECYEPNKPYCLYAFGSPGASYSVDVNDDFNDTVVYSGNFTGNIQAVIPVEAFAADDLIYGLRVCSSSSPEEPIICSTLFKTAEYNPNSPARMIVSVGSEVASTYCKDVIEKVINAGHIKFGDTKYVIPLRFGDSTWDNVKRWLQLPDVKIWVHFSHGYYGPKSWWNEIVHFNGTTVSAFDSWHYPHSIEELGFKENPKLNFVYFHSCYSAYTDQFAEALGVLPIDYYEGLGIRAFIGWTDVVIFRDSISIKFRSYNTYTIELWDMLGSSNSLRQAKAAAERKCKDDELLENLSLELLLYGISPDPHLDGSERTYFSYPNIYSPSGW